jgi:hypothetical protein
MQRLGALAAPFVLGALFLPVTVLGSWYVVSSFFGEERISLESRLIHIFGLGVGVWMLLWLLQQVRYRHAYRSTYVVDAQGIEVDSLELRRQIRWDEFELAEHFPLFFFARLKSAQLPKPVVIFLTTESRQAETKSEFARNLIEERMGSRYKRGWLL